MNAPANFRTRDRQHGVAAVEFALVAGLLFTLLIGIMEFSRISFYWNAATEATRLGARLAVVCDMNDAAIKARMTALFPVLSADKIAIQYSPDGCAIDTCRQVHVTVNSPDKLPIDIPGLHLDVIFPPFVTTLPRESMKSTFGGMGNPVCL